MRRFTVEGLHREVGRLLGSRFPGILVEGEIGDLKAPPNGHRYITLRSGNAVLSAVVWANHWQNCRYKPKIGDRVVCRGRLDVYPPRGSYQLYVTGIVPAGEGRLAAEIAKRRKRLLADGLLDPRRKRALPAFPRVVGVATSLGSAALQDFLKVSRSRWPAAKVLVAGCAVQGREAPASILRAVELLVEDGRSEVVIVTRGGGSKEDLLAFQDERLARALADCPVPVVSAVGHQIDETLCDLVADRIAATPSDAAVVALPDGPGFRRRLVQSEQGLYRSARVDLRRRRQALDGLGTRLRHPGEKLRLQRRRVEELTGRLEREIQRVVRVPRVRIQAAERQLPASWARIGGSARGQLEVAERALRALSPLAVLDRGYAIARIGERVVRHPMDVEVGASLVVRVAGGEITTTVVSRSSSSAASSSSSSSSSRD